MTEMIPTTLSEALLALDTIVSQEVKDHFLKSDESFDDLVADVHHSLGRYLRNTWGLWKGSPLAEHMKTAQGVEHPDDMSHALIVAYFRQHVRTRFERIA